MKKNCANDGNNNNYNDMSIHVILIRIGASIRAIDGLCTLYDVRDLWEKL